MKLRSVLLAATALCGAVGPALAGDLAFAPVAVPTDDAAMRSVVATGSATFDGTAVATGYTVLYRTGDKLGDATFGMVLDKDGKPVTGAASTNPDYTSLLPVGGKLFSVTHFEDLPAAMYLSELAQDADGTLKPVWTKPVDFTGVGGLWNPCAGSVTPWNTHLGSEEYPTDARAVEAAKEPAELDEEAVAMAAYFGLDPATMTADDFRTAVNPYRYGFPTEVAVSEAGEASVAKHHAMGRLSVELANVMPDRKTAYITDDGTNVGLFRFVADKEDDLSAGQLFAAKWVQTSDKEGGAADIEWVDLGHADDATIGAAIEKGTKFSDIFETADFGADGKCPEGFLVSIAEGRSECLKVKPGMEAVASRLETRRYASMLGGTTEFRKMEGSAYDPGTNTFFVAMSEIGKGMKDNDEKADLGGRNDIRLDKNGCGAVYEMALDGAFVGHALKALVTGKPTEYAAGSPYEGQTCDVEGIANPDNITFIPGYDTLIIGEDTGDGHRNDAVWAYSMTGKTLTRIATTPYGAEATSVDWYPDVNGHAYLTMVVQHPFGESDEDKLQDQGEKRGYVGYIGPFPAVK